MCSFDDAVLKKMYSEYGTPCDRLVSDPAQLVSFTSDYAKRTGVKAEPSKLAQRLLALRKLGQEKGGLSRLGRSYNGRN
jgi:hypothetical protein